MLQHSVIVFGQFAQLLDKAMGVIDDVLGVDAARVHVSDEFDADA
jgi:hypothetical protein